MATQSFCRNRQNEPEHGGGNKTGALAGLCMVTMIAFNKQTEITIKAEASLQILRETGACPNYMLKKVFCFVFLHPAEKTAFSNQASELK